MTRGTLFVLGLVVVVAALAVSLIAVLGLGRNADPVGLHVMPFPGTPDASPLSQISFPALAPSQLTSVTVQGSRSGPHNGRLSALPDGRGTAFVPDSPFLPGERVSVRAALSSPAAGIASGAGSTSQITSGFTVAAPAASTTSTTPAASSQSAKPPATRGSPPCRGTHPRTATAMEEVLAVPERKPAALVICRD